MCNSVLQLKRRVMMTTNALHLTIDGHPHTTKDADQLASDLIFLGGKDPAAYDLFRVGHGGVEDHVKDRQILNLREGDRFVTRAKVHFTVDGEPQTSWDDDLTAAAILRRVGLDPTQYDLARVGGHGGTAVLPADDVITLHDGDEFVTAKRIGGVA